MNQPTKVLFGEAAIKKILKGIDIGYEAVRQTMGPEGRNAIIYGTYARRIRITNDGWTVLESIELKDEFEAMGLNALKEAVDRTNRAAGDGTSCTTVLGGKGARIVFRSLAERVSAIGGSTVGVMTVRRKIMETAAKVEKMITERAEKVKTLEELERIAAISVENPELGKLIAGMAWKTGEGGFIDVVEGFKGEIESEVIEGARFPARVGGKGFVNNASAKIMEAKDVAVLLTNYELDNVSRLGGFLNPIIMEKQVKKIAIFAPAFSKDVLEELWKASYRMLSAGVKQKTDVELYPILVPSLRTEQFEDLEVYFGARFIDKNKGMKLENIRVEDFGSAAKIVVKDTDTRDDAIALGGGGTKSVAGEKTAEKPKKVEMETPVESRMRILKDQIKETKEESHKNLLRRRVAGLGSAVGVIKVCAATDSETFYLKKKIEDAVYACKAAQEEGYVKGGGLCLKEIAETLPDTDLLKEVLMQPYKQIQENAGGALEIADSVIDPAKAIRLAVKNAFSMVATLITIGTAIPEERELSPGEGYQQLAIAVEHAIFAWKKWQGILDENDKEIAKDAAVDHDRILRTEG